MTRGDEPIQTASIWPSGRSRQGDPLAGERRTFLEPGELRAKPENGLTTSINKVRLPRIVNRDAATASAPCAWVASAARCGELFAGRSPWSSWSYRWMQVNRASPWEDAATGTPSGSELSALRRVQTPRRRRNDVVTTGPRPRVGSVQQRLDRDEGQPDTKTGGHVQEHLDPLQPRPVAGQQSPPREKNHD